MNLGKDKTNLKVPLWDMMAWSAKKSWGKGKIWPLYTYLNLAQESPSYEVQRTQCGSPGLHSQRGLGPGNNEKEVRFVSRSCWLPIRILACSYPNLFLWLQYCPQQNKVPWLLCTLRLWLPDNSPSASQVLLPHFLQLCFLNFRSTELLQNKMMSDDEQVGHLHPGHPSLASCHIYYMFPFLFPCIWLSVCVHMIYAIFLFLSLNHLRYPDSFLSIFGCPKNKDIT